MSRVTRAHRAPSRTIFPRLINHGGHSQAFFDDERRNLARTDVGTSSSSDEDTDRSTDVDDSEYESPILKTVGLSGSSNGRGRLWVKGWMLVTVLLIALLLFGGITVIILEAVGVLPVR